MSCRLLALLTSVFLYCAASAAPATTTASTQAGTLGGVRTADGRVDVFKGVPYAQPPLGELRWRAPQDLASWSGTRSASQFGPRCMQSDRLGDIDPLNPRMDEDCLYLNVWAPAQREGKRPVMVWIHGGGFTAGAGSEPWYSGESFARRGVVFVTINYRLDVFGFLAHPQLPALAGCEASGNFGLLDQVAALRWVRRNIAAFGGDPDAVTVVGESAGSVSVSILMASPAARGLFQRAIGQSGASFMPSRSPYTLIRPDVAAADGADFARSSGARTVEELRRLPAQQLLDESLKSTKFFGRFGPVLDRGCVAGVDAPFIFAKGAQNDVPLLIGWTADEGTLFNLRRRSDPAYPRFADDVRARFSANAERLLRLYPAQSTAQAEASSDALLGDDLVGYPMWRWIQAQKRTGKAPVYRFLFDWRPPAPEVSRNPLAGPGVFHSAEIPYALDNLAAMPWPWRDSDRRVAQIMSSYWINFATQGDPNGAGLPHWPVYAGGDDGEVMHFGSDARAIKQPRQEHFRLLDDLYREP